MTELQAFSAVLTALVALYAAVATYRLGKQKNAIDEQKNAIDVHKTALEDLGARQKASDDAATERAKRREIEREQDRKDRESAAAARLSERESDLRVMDLYRQQVIAADKDIREVREENRGLTTQLLEVSHKNDTLDREFRRSEEDREAKTTLLIAAQTELGQVSLQLRSAYATIGELRTEMNHQHDLHELRLESLNQLNASQAVDFQRQIDQIKSEHHSQLEQIQINEVPRQREITHLRYTLREVNKRLSQEQVEGITHDLQEHGIHYEALLFPKPDPILLMPQPGGDNNEPPPGGAIDPTTGEAKKIA